MQDQTPEQQLQALRDQLTDANSRAAQAEQALKTERDARGRAEQDLTDANLVIDQLNEAANEAQPTRPAPVATLGSGKDARQYRILAPQFHLPGFGTVQAEAVKNNSPELKKLVEVGAGVIELVTPAAK